MRVLVCGSRDFDDESVIAAVLLGSRGASGFGPTHVIHGAASGADALAARVVERCRRDFIELRFPADWSLGKAAGPIRNQLMLDKGEPDIVYAFVNKPLSESKGTADLVRRAQAAGIRTYVVATRPLAVSLFETETA